MRKLILAFLICCTTAAFAQKTNFSGTWKLDTAKTVFGQAPQNIIPWTIKVDQHADQLVLSRISLDTAMQELSPVNENLAFNGTPFKRTAGGVQVVTTLHWLNDASFNLTRNGEKLNATETWSLENTGKNLVIDRSVEQKSNGLKYMIKCYYGRQ